MYLHIYILLRPCCYTGLLMVLWPFYTKRNMSVSQTLFHLFSEHPYKEILSPFFREEVKAQKSNGPKVTTNFSYLGLDFQNNLCALITSATEFGFSCEYSGLLQIRYHFNLGTQEIMSTPLVTTYEKFGLWLALITEELCDRDRILQHFILLQFFFLFATHLSTSEANKAEVPWTIFSSTYPSFRPKAPSVLGTEWSRGSCKKKTCMKSYN